MAMSTMSPLASWERAVFLITREAVLSGSPNPIAPKYQAGKRWSGAGNQPRRCPKAAERFDMPPCLVMPGSWHLLVK